MCLWHVKTAWYVISRFGIGTVAVALQFHSQGLWTMTCVPVAEALQILIGTGCLLSSRRSRRKVSHSAFEPSGFRVMFDWFDLTFKQVLGFRLVFCVRNVSPETVAATRFPLFSNSKSHNPWRQWESPSTAFSLLHSFNPKTRGLQASRRLSMLSSVPSLRIKAFTKLKI